MQTSKISGFTLLELLITLGLSACILSGVYVFFSSQSQAYLTQQALMHMQETGRVAVNMLRDRLRQAGGLACISWNEQVPVYIQAQTLPAGLPQQAYQVVHGYQGKGTYWDPPLPNYLMNRVRTDTDVLLVHHAYEDAANLLQNMPNAESPLSLPAHLNLQIGDVLMLADCQQADILQISGLSRQGEQWWLAHQPPYNKSSALSKQYNKDAQVSVLRSAAYYVGETGRYYANGDPVFALYQFTEQHQELIEGVTDLQVEYGLDTNGDGSVDMIMANAPQMGQGILKSILLLLKTEMDSLQQNWYLSVALRN